MPKLQLTSAEGAAPPSTERQGKLREVVPIYFMRAKKQHPYTNFPLFHFFQCSSYQIRSFMIKQNTCVEPPTSIFKDLEQVSVLVIPSRSQRVFL